MYGLSLHGPGSVASPFRRAPAVAGQPPPRTAPADLDHDFAAAPPGANTTLAVIATDAHLTRAQAKRVACMAHDGFARAIRPVHSPLDGDTVFVLATGAIALADPVGDLPRLGLPAADCTARALPPGVYAAAPLAGWPAHPALPSPCRCAADLPTCWPQVGQGGPGLATAAVTEALSGTRSVVAPCFGFATKSGPRRAPGKHAGHFSMYFGYPRLHFLQTVAPMSQTV